MQKCGKRFTNISKEGCKSVHAKNLYEWCKKHLTGIVAVVAGIFAFILGRKSVTCSTDFRSARDELEQLRKQVEFDRSELAELRKLKADSDGRIEQLESELSKSERTVAALEGQLNSDGNLINDSRQKLSDTRTDIRQIREAIASLRKQLQPSESEI